MKRLVLVVIGPLALAIALLAVRGGLESAAVAHTYRNPVIRTDFADPAVIRASDGWYYAYSTEQLTIVRMANIQVARSRDLVTWELLPDALPEKPAFASRTRDFWAPGIIEAEDRYFLYFAALQNDESAMCLGVASADTGAGPFVPRDEPLACEDGETIDPMPFDDPVTGRRLLLWGSGRRLYARELAPNRQEFADGSEARVILTNETLEFYESLIEAPWLVRHDDWYVLFYSGSDCCSDEPFYAVMAARARDPFGPYERRSDEKPLAGANVILEFGQQWDGTGHNAVVTDPRGQDWILYHAMRPEDRFQPGVHAVKRPMLLDRLDWRDGWPVVRDGHPSNEATAAPAF